MPKKKMSHAPTPSAIVDLFEAGNSTRARDEQNVPACLDHS
jgi:hypothetical protein